MRLSQPEPRGLRDQLLFETLADAGVSMRSGVVQMGADEGRDMPQRAHT